MSDVKRKATSQAVSTDQSISQASQKKRKALPDINPPDVKFRLDERGKVHYHARDDAQTQQSAAYKTLSAPDFVRFKNAGKRYSSNKFTDTTDMRNYVFNGGQYYLHQKGGNPQGQLAPNQDELKQRFESGLVIKRSRDDRTGKALQPFDLGHYKKAPTGSRMDTLSGKSENFGANRDHVISGESLKRRAKKANKDANAAYNEGLTIAIPNGLMHRPHSATYGGRQGTKDTIGTDTKPRVEHDTLKPAHGFYRDVKTMLDRTSGKNLGGAFDMQQQSNKLTQLGAYRKMFRANIAMNAADPTRGLNPGEVAHKVEHTPGKRKPANIGSFTSTEKTGKTMGQQMQKLLTKRLT